MSEGQSLNSNITLGLPSHRKLRSLVSTTVDKETDRTVKTARNIPDSHVPIKGKLLSAVNQFSKRLDCTEYTYSIRDKYNMRLFKTKSFNNIIHWC